MTPTPSPAPTLKSLEAQLSAAQASLAGAQETIQGLKASANQAPAVDPLSLSGTKLNRLGLDDLSSFVFSLNRVKDVEPGHDIARPVEMLRELVDSKIGVNGELWIVSHKADLADGARSLGVLSNRQLAVAHVSQTLGVRGTAIIDSDHKDYMDYITKAQPELLDEVKRLGGSGQKALVFMTFPNQPFIEAAAQYPGQFIMTCPVPTVDGFLTLENKVTFAGIAAEISRRHPDLADCFSKNLVVSPEEVRANGTYEKLVNELGEGFFAQVAFGCSGLGTTQIKDETKWNEFVEQVEKDGGDASFKMTEQVKGTPGYPPYAANGGGAVVKISGDGCVVYVDPLSHKPTGDERNGGNFGEGVGNCWANSFNPDITAKYFKLTQAIGQYLHETYGYTGMFGPDCLIGIDAQGKEHLKCTEINPRTQGTTPYQTLSAVTLSETPTEFVHLAAKLSNGELDEGFIKEMMGGNPDEVFERRNRKGGGFYLKLPGPTETTTVKEELTGAYLYNKVTGDLVKLEILGERFKTAEVWALGREFQKAPIAEGDVIPVMIKGPRLGQEVKRGITSPGYLTGFGSAVFLPDRPELEPWAGKLHQDIKRRMYGEQKPAEPAEA